MTNKKGNNGNRPTRFETETDPEILHMMKSGASFMIPEYLKQQKEEYPLDFVRFMDQMLQEKKMKRNEIPAKTGLSTDYTYKILSGKKKAGDRDYIIAICLALGLTFAQTQHALRCDGKPLLSRNDPRANLIILGIEHGLDIHRINEMLEKQNMPYIRVTPDMPKAVITDSLYETEQPSKNAAQEEPQGTSWRETEEEMEILETTAEAEHSGPAPFDYDYIGHMTVQDPQGKKYYLEAAYLITGDTIFSVHDEEEHKKWTRFQESLKKLDEEGAEGASVEVPELNYLESYKSILDTADSSFFPFFMKLDRLTDDKVLEVMKKVNDTRNYGTRFGTHMGGTHGWESYIEVFNNQQPEKREYFQMIENWKGECRYTASHESCFLGIEMEGFFEAYYPREDEPEYYLQETDKTFDQMSERHQKIFRMLRFRLHQYMESEFGTEEIPAIKYHREAVDYLLENSETIRQAGVHQEASKELDRAESMIPTCEYTPEEELVKRLFLLWKRYILASDTGNQKKAASLEKEILSQLDKIKAIEKSIEQPGEVYDIFIRLLMSRYQQIHTEGDGNTSEVVRQAVDLIENHGACAKEGFFVPRFLFYSAYAFELDSTDVNAAEEYYLKAIQEVKKHHIDTLPGLIRDAAGLYNNYAWVLWNKMGSEEAVIYYGRAIEIMETALGNGAIPKEQAIKALEHFGDALLSIYEETSRDRERARLLKRLIKDGVDEQEIS